MKQIISFALALLLLVALVPPLNASASENTNVPTVNPVDTVYNNGFTEIEVTADSFSYIEANFDIPPEVISDLQTMIERRVDGAKITLCIPNNMPYGIESEVSTAATEYPGWSSARTYKGYTIKDYIVKVSNAHDMTVVIPENSNNDTLVQYFTKKIMAYCGTTVIDSINPFGGIAVDLIDFFYSSCEGIPNNIEASRKDKLSCAPKYTAYTYYTAIVLDGRNLVYATTFKSVLEQIAWYYYSYSSHTQYFATRTYNKSLYSTNHLSRDECAYQAMQSVVHVDKQIKIKINDINFWLN